MDVNLREEAIRNGPNGEPYNPGAGGWPTVRYFNKETGIAGGTYQKKTNLPMCQELGNEDNMIAYVEEYGKTALCAVGSEEGCSEKEIGYITKMRNKSGEDLTAALERLVSMEDWEMAEDLRKWLNQRKRILNQMIVLTESDDDVLDDDVLDDDVFDGDDEEDEDDEGSEL